VPDDQQESFARGFAGVVAAGTLAACSSEKAAVPVAATSSAVTPSSRAQAGAGGPLTIGYAEPGRPTDSR